MSTKIKILIAEHDAVDLELLHNELKKSGINYIFQTVQNEIDYSNALKHFVPDIILADYTFPSFDGPTAFGIKERLAPDTPFIFVSGTIGEEKSIELIKNGVTDYALKDRMFTLTPKITRALKEAKVIQQKKITEQQRTIDGLKLEQQNNELIKLHAELDHFVDSTTHDLRSPLDSILGVVDLIEQESKELHTLELVKIIKRSVNRLDEFVTDILNYSQNNRTELKVEIIPIQKLTEEIVDSLQNAPGAKGINFEVRIDEEEPFYSDLRRIEIALKNLIANAIKYHKQDVHGRYISITGKAYKQYLHLCIQDNGIGIDAMHHDDIFNMFFRLPSKVKGSGFGLYIVKETIKKLDGSIEVDSEKGSGTSFIIKIKNFLPAVINTA
jgi:signal transduction histidine kinase